MRKDQNTAPALTLTGKLVDGTVKFFNPDKGYGFITPDGSYQDVFVHKTQIQASGLTGLRELDRISFVLAVDAKRSDRTVATQIVITSSKTEQREAGKVARSDTGTIKWFNKDRGFGFIAPDGGGKDAFVHITALEAAGLQLPLDGTRVAFVLKEGKTGRFQAEELSLV